MTDRLKIGELLRAKRVYNKGPIEDKCPVCNEPCRAFDEVWREPWVVTTEGLVSTANYCNEECEGLAQAWAEDVANALRRRKGVVGKS